MSTLSKLSAVKQFLDGSRSRGEEWPRLRASRTKRGFGYQTGPKRLSVDISIYLYLLTSNMCNVPAPLRRRHDAGTPPFSRLRRSAARERAPQTPPLPTKCSIIKSPVGGVTHSVFFVTSLVSGEGGRFITTHV